LGNAKDEQESPALSVRKTRYTAYEVSVAVLTFNVLALAVSHRLTTLACNGLHGHLKSIFFM